MANPNTSFQKNILPGLQVPAGLPPDLAKFLRAVKEALQGGHGTLGQPGERFVTVAELERIGVVRTVTKGGRMETRSVNDTDARGIGGSTTAADSGSGPDFSEAGADDGDTWRYSAVAGSWVPFPLFDSNLRVPLEALVQIPGQSVVGLAALPNGDISYIVAGTDDTILRQTAGELNFGALTTGMFPSGSPGQSLVLDSFGEIAWEFLILDDLFDVDAAAPVDGDVLTWVDADDEWQALPPTATGGGYPPQLGYAGV